MSAYRTNDFELLPPLEVCTSDIPGKMGTVSRAGDLQRVGTFRTLRAGMVMWVEEQQIAMQLQGDLETWLPVTMLNTLEYWYIHQENELFAAVDERNVGPFIITLNRDKAYRFGSPEAAYRALERVRALSGNNDWAVLSSRA